MRRACVDANVILRFLTNDPPEMAEQAAAVFAAAQEGSLVLNVAEIVVAETVWVLQSFYKYPHEAIAQVLSELLANDGIESEDKPGLLAALAFYQAKNVDFADALLAVHARRQGIAEVFSFDRHFDRLPGIVRLAPGS